MMLCQTCSVYYQMVSYNDSEMYNGNSNKVVKGEKQPTKCPSLYNSMSDLSVDPGVQQVNNRNISILT